MNEDIIVYSCIFGEYDKINEPWDNNSEVHYILFTNNFNLKSKNWDIRYIDLKELGIEDPQRAARYIKLNPKLFLPKEHKINIWIDSCYEIRITHWDLFIKTNLINNICLYKHPCRHCVYEEIKVCSNLKLDYKNLFIKQKEKYLKEGLPYYYGLYHTAVLLRKNNEIVNKFNQLWWKELNEFSKRDQISFSYCLWKLKITPNIISPLFGFDLYKSKYFKKYKHIKERNRYD